MAAIETNTHQVALVDHELEQLLHNEQITLPILQEANNASSHDGKVTPVERSDAAVDVVAKARDLDLVQPASLDIPIGSEAYSMRDRVLPFNKKLRTLLQQDAVLETKHVHPDDGLLLLKGQIYLFHCGTVKLKQHQRGSLSPKSSIGRVDLMVRGLFDECGLYDTVVGEGELWLEVTPRSFNVRVKHGQTLSQLMIFENRPGEHVPRPLSEVALREHTLSYDGAGNPLPLHVHRGAVVLSLNVSPMPRSNGVVGFEALPTSAVIDLSKIDDHDASKFFRPVLLSEPEKAVTLLKDHFYILSTKEYISIPTHLSAEMVPFSQHIGELRAHYAGFFDPGFGYGKEGEVKGTVGVLEVRPHETITVYDGQPICLIEYFNNSAQPRKPYGHARNNYHNQKGPKLAKYFVNNLQT